MGVRAAGRGGDRDEGARRSRASPASASGTPFATARRGPARRSRSPAGAAALVAALVVVPHFAPAGQSAFESRYAAPSLDGRDLDVPGRRCSSRSRSCRSPRRSPALAALPELGLNLLSATLTQTSSRSHYAAVAVAGAPRRRGLRRRHGSACGSRTLAVLAPRSPGCVLLGPLGRVDLRRRRATTRQPGVRSRSSPPARPSAPRTRWARISPTARASSASPCSRRRSGSPWTQQPPDLPRQPEAATARAARSPHSDATPFATRLRRGRRPRLRAALVDRNRLRQEVGAEAERGELRPPIVVDRRERERPDHVPGRQAGRRREQQAAGQPERVRPRARLAREPGKAGRQRRRPRAARASACGTPSCSSRWGSA